MRISNADALLETRALIMNRLANQGQKSFVVAEYRSVLGGRGELLVLRQATQKGEECYFSGMMAGNGVRQEESTYKGGTFKTKRCTVEVVYGFHDADAANRYHAALLITMNDYKLTKTIRKRKHKDCK